MVNFEKKYMQSKSKMQNVRLYCVLYLNVLEHPQQIKKHPITATCNFDRMEYIFFHTEINPKKLDS